jgi:hypothetical protein
VSANLSAHVAAYLFAVQWNALGYALFEVFLMCADMRQANACQSMIRLLR